MWSAALQRRFCNRSRRAIDRSRKHFSTHENVRRPSNRKTRRRTHVKTFLKGFAVGTLALFLLALLFLETGWLDIRADVVPSPPIARFLEVATHSSVRRHAPESQSPLPQSSDNEEVLIAGGKLYLNDCVGCHGEPGKPSQFGATFYPPVPQLAQTPTRYSESQIVWIAKHGIRRSGMGAEGNSYSDIDYWCLAAFIRQLSQLSPHVLAAINPPAPVQSASPDQSDVKK